jgi:FkbM family methyltransferase
LIREKFKLDPEHKIDLQKGYELEVVNVIQHFVRPGDCVVDAGACIGFHTCLLSKLVGEKGAVLAFEPNMRSYKYLLRHVFELNKFTNVACFRTALWNHNLPSMELSSVEDLGYSSLYPYGNAMEVEIVEGRTLDSLIFNRPRLIKIDCEGAEAEVLSGAHKTLERGVDAVIVEFNYNLLKCTGRSDHLIREYMNSLGYDMFLISISDGNGGLMRPLKVGLEYTIDLRKGFHLNVLFSTEEKVKERWQ